MIATISNAVLEVGKEASIYRLNKNEKLALTEIIFQFRISGKRISENEIVRIAINFVLLNYQNKMDTSILTRVYRNLKP